MDMEKSPPDNKDNKNQKDGVMLYVHIPFCASKCPYCAFYSAVPTRAAVDGYISSLVRRIRSLPAVKFNTVYFGGGTPLTLGEDNICFALDEIFSSADVAANAEITFEANPQPNAEHSFKKLASAGFNRLSLGLQSGDDDVLKTIGRRHTSADFVNAARAGKELFPSVSGDIIFALPGGGVEKTVETVLSLGFDHISAYSLILEEGTPMFKNRCRYPLPDEEKEESEYFYICQKLKQAGFYHYEVSAFAKPGHESRHNLGYWRRLPYIGIGPSAHSFYRGVRFSTPPDTGLFIKNSSLPFLADTDFYEKSPLTPEEEDEERIMLGLRTSRGVSLSGEKLKKAEKFIKLGYGGLDGDRFYLNDKGYRVSNAIISELI
ncbi:MAG: radical SAM family heme chaperone HemW [Eubacteriales bacterium]